MTMQASRYADTITLLKIIDSMREHGIHPNEVTYEILVLRYAEMQHLELALQVLHQLTTDGLQPTLKTTQAIIRTAGILGLPRLAMDLAESFESISVRSLEPSDWVDCLVACAETLWVSGRASCVALETDTRSGRRRDAGMAQGRSRTECHAG